MKSKNKLCPVTARATKQELEIIAKNAKQNHQSISRYVVERAISTEGISLTQKREIYLSLLKVRDAVLYQSENPELNKLVREECEAIWKSLKL